MDWGLQTLMYFMVYTQYLIDHVQSQYTRCSSSTKQYHNNISTQYVPKGSMSECTKDAVKCGLR